MSDTRGGVRRARWCQTHAVVSDTRGGVRHAVVSDTRWWTRAVVSDTDWVGGGVAEDPRRGEPETGGRTTRATVCRPPFRERRAPSY
ncbi:MAG: hypothetical protein LBK25_04570 [Treponema sp.]|nr:hypothetical protein [Treponema sp.]